jgi:hypothetical protein
MKSVVRKTRLLGDLAVATKTTPKPPRVDKICAVLQATFHRQMAVVRAKVFYKTANAKPFVEKKAPMQ